MSDEILYDRDPRYIPRVAAVHDMCGYGKCSLTAAIPILSAAGCDVCPVPTALFSAHTRYEVFTFHDTTEILDGYLDAWRKENVELDGVYSGFLGSADQVAIIRRLYDEYPHALRLVDPVMGDHGRPYRTITPQMRSRLGELVRVADIITPNLTEACMLLKIPYFNEGLSRAQAKSLLVRLSELGPNYVVITGAPMASGSIANIGYDRQNNSFWYIDCDYVPVSYPGTGDLFASVLTGGFLTGDSLPMAMGRATYFVERCIKTTFSYSSDTRYGVMLEKELGVLIDRQNIKDFSLL